MSTYQGASTAAIQHHYDLGNEFYALWLDASRTYSCALWDGYSDTLEAAQMRKLDYLAEGARAPRARRVLDVGCGWGSMARRLIEHHGVQRVTGLTLSVAQAEHIATWSDGRYDVRVENWADHRPDEPYDAIVSIGAFEHFADLSMTRRTRVAAYRQFFAACRDWLPAGGRLALQTITKGSNVRLDRATTRDLLFVIDRIFPESELPWLSEAIEASERLFDVVSIRCDPDHYARTCQCWLDGLRANRERVVELHGEQVFADYERYLRSSVDVLVNRHVGLARLILERV
jgi:cyclopropane-fatty-acyl-phospholipid synthase